jgi:hypothetical protein
MWRGIRSKIANLRGVTPCADKERAEMNGVYMAVEGMQHDMTRRLDVLRKEYEVLTEQHAPENKP